ncbi:hypothetical protein I553_10315 [Mycobacterium xenopi 4042]|uniref:Uncharacterized protein n=1 Tax=Mycobacterium xenopi 4042 TaxID=1299334 RepID=X7ZKQ2_MYCXE|nr:hypothetical protein I553_10315 [Mycobacterium xenopi 4042]
MTQPHRRLVHPDFRAPPAPAREEPYMEGHNIWVANHPGSLLAFPWLTWPST